MKHDQPEATSGHSIWISARVPREMLESKSPAAIRAIVKEQLEAVGIRFENLGSNQLAPDPFVEGGLPDGAY